MRNKFSRRAALQGGLALAAGAAGLGAAQASGRRGARWPFPQGVASGDPGPDRVVLWTRLVVPDGRPEVVRWQVSHDKEGRHIVRRGKVLAEPAKVGALKVDVDGLAPGRTYYYRFYSKGHASPLGRTRTLPEGRVDHIRLALASCANYEGGYYNNYRAIAQQKRLSAVIHLGDYIYEYAPGVYGGHKERQTTLPGESLGYGDYVARYAHYRSDPDLQALHAAHPVIAVWDDHEIANDSWARGAQNHDATEGSYLKRRAAAMRAWDEWMPVRAPLGQIYRRFAFGDLFHLLMIDARHEGRSRRYDWEQFIRNTGRTPRFDAALFDKRIRGPERQIWSKKQQTWFEEALREAGHARARWVVVGNQMPVSGLTMPDLSAAPQSISQAFPSFIRQGENLRQLAAASGEEVLPVNLDSWGSFPASQRTMLAALAHAAPAPLILTGDFHLSWAARLTLNGYPFGCEIGVPSISSPRFLAGSPQAGRHLTRAFHQANPNLLFSESTRRGYVVLDIGRSRASALWLYNPVDKPGLAEEAGSYLEIPRLRPGAGQWRNLLQEPS